MLEKVVQNGAKIVKNDSKMVLKSLQHLSTNRFKNQCEICGPKIDQTSSLGAPKGRQTEFGDPPGVTLGGPKAPVQQERRTVFTVRQPHQRKDPDTPLGRRPGEYHLLTEFI